MAVGAWLRMLGLGAGLSLAHLGAAMASAHIVDIQWDASGRFVHKAEIQAGKFVEVCGALKPGQKITWSFQGSAPMNFNIHYHLGKETVFPAKLSAVKDAAQTLNVQAEQMHCWMWSNKGAALATLDLDLKIEP